MAFMPSMRWFKLKEVRNEKYNGKHWEWCGMRPLKGETADQYRARWHELNKGIVIGNGVPTVVLLGRDAEIVHVSATWKLIQLLGQSRVRGRNGELPKWNWVAISQGGDVEMRKFKWRARVGMTIVFKGAGKRNTAARVAVYAAEIQEQKRREKMAEEKARLEAYNKKFQETLAAGDIPEAPDWQ